MRLKVSYLMRVTKRRCYIIFHCVSVGQAETTLELLAYLKLKNSSGSLVTASKRLLSSCPENKPVTKRSRKA